MENLSKRLRVSVGLDAHNGDAMERGVCGRQMLEAADRLDTLEGENAKLRERLKAALALCDDVIGVYDHADFSNGNTYGTIDEGVVLAGEMFERFRKRREEIASLSHTEEPDDAN